MQVINRDLRVALLREIKARIKVIGGLLRRGLCDQRKSLVQRSAQLIIVALGNQDSQLLEDM